MKKLYVFFVLVILAGIFFLLYQKFAYLNIVVKFDDLEPLEKQMNVYYKGFKIGKTTKIYPDKNYQNTYLKLKIFPHNINLPENISARIKKSRNIAYISILYPDNPALSKIKNNVVIKGTLSKDINSILNEKFDDDGIDEIVDDATTLMESANITIQNLGDIFLEIDEIIKESKNDIRSTISSLADSAENLEQISSNLKESLKKEQMAKSIGNIEKTTENINEITKNLNKITYQIDNTTLPIVNSVLCETNSTVKNVDDITSGIKNTLKKRFGLGRIMFGKPIQDTQYCKY